MQHLASVSFNTTLVAEERTNTVLSYAFSLLALAFSFPWFVKASP